MPLTTSGRSLSDSHIMKNKYVCSLCNGCKPTKRNNIEQHVWQMHSDRHGANSSNIKYRAATHKQYVERFVVPCTPTQAAAHSTGTMALHVTGSPLSEHFRGSYNLLRAIKGGWSSSPRSSLSSRNDFDARTDQLRNQYDFLGHKPQSDHRNTYHEEPLYSPQLSFSSNYDSKKQYYDSPRNVDSKCHTKSRYCDSPNLSRDDKYVDPDSAWTALNQTAEVRMWRHSTQNIPEPQSSQSLWSSRRRSHTVSALPTRMSLPVEMEMDFDERHSDGSEYCEYDYEYNHSVSHSRSHSHPASAYTRSQWEQVNAMQAAEMMDQMHYESNQSTLWRPF